MTPRLSAEQVREVLDYDPVTGQFRWRCNTARCVKPGDRAGTVAKGGYVRITIGRRPYFAHRLALLIVNGGWPSDHVDHVDGDRSNNALANLRPATRSQNRANSKMTRTNKAGLKGVCFVRGRWIASIKHNRKSKHLGCFDTSQAAHAAYVLAAKQIHGEFARAA